MPVPPALIKLSHARDFLRQHYAVDAGLDPMNPIPLGSRFNEVDPAIMDGLKAIMDQCRNKAHWEVSALIANATISVWREHPNGRLEHVGAKWAHQAFEAKGSKIDELYFDRDEWNDHLPTITSSRARTVIGQKTAWEASMGAPDIPQACADPSLISWSDFPPSTIAKFERHALQAADDSYFTWPEALTWVGSRDIRNIATLRYFGSIWHEASPKDQEISLGAQYYSARQFCASHIDEELKLHRAIERGDIATLGRAATTKPAEPLAKEKWRGGKIIIVGGNAVLASKADPSAAWSHDISVDRKMLFAAFPPRPLWELQSTQDIPKHRHLNHDEIRKRAAELRAMQPNISKGSAAASIACELPDNPRTGKPRDTRHIERIIGCLWGGG